MSLGVDDQHFSASNRKEVIAFTTLWVIQYKIDIIFLKMYFKLSSGAILASMLNVSFLVKLMSRIM